MAKMSTAFSTLQNLNQKEKIMADELIDIYDENMNHIGTASRSQVHQEGLWHKAFHCWIARRDNDCNKVILQLRSKNKKENPHLLATSAAGHLSTGETAKDGIREIEEELGLVIDFDKLTKLFTSTQVSEYGDYINHEFNPTYLLESDVKLSELKLQPEEVDGVYEAKVEDIITLFRGEIKSIKLSGFIRNEDNTLSASEIKAKREDFEPKGADHFIKTMEAIKRHFNGSKN